MDHTRASSMQVSNGTGPSVQRRPLGIPHPSLKLLEFGQVRKQGHELVKWLVDGENTERCSNCYKIESSKAIKVEPFLF